MHPGAADGGAESLPGLVTIDRVAVADRQELLALSTRLGYSTLQPIFLTCTIASVVWALATILIVPESCVARTAVALPLALASALGLATLLNRTRVKVTASGLEWGTGPIPVPDYLFQASLRKEEIAAVFVSPRAISNRYSATYIHSYEVFVLTSGGIAERLLSRIKTAAAARELAGLIRQRLNLGTGWPVPQLAASTRSLTDSKSILPNDWPVWPFCAALILVGLLVFATHTSRWPAGAGFIAAGAAGLALMAFLRRRHTSSILEQDSFRRLDGNWDLTPHYATAAKGALNLTGPPGSTLTPVLCRSAFSSPTIEVQVMVGFGKSDRLAAGILFWADGLGDGYAFTVVPGWGGVDAWRIRNGKFEKAMEFVRVPQVTTAWNTLQVITRDRQAWLYVNGAPAGMVEGDPPPGGSLAGLFAGFPGDTNSSWLFSGFRVTQT